MLAISIDDASAKVKPAAKDDEEDYARDTWAGVVPLKLQRQLPIADELLKEGVPLPELPEVAAPNFFFMSYTLAQHLEFNAWANGRVAEVLQPLSDELFYRENKGSFPSLAKTTLHIWGSQYIWYRRMQGESLKQAPMVAQPPAKIDLLNGLLQSSADFVTFVKSKDPDFLSARYHYLNLRGEPFDDTYEETLFHVVNHGTYHRGQLINMLRDLGVLTLPGTDLIHYLRSQRQ